MKKSDILNFGISYIGIGIMFFLTMARAKVFTPTEVGIYSYIISISLMISTGLNFGIKRIILKYYNRNIKTDFIKKVLKIQIVIYFIFTILYFVFINLFINIKYGIYIVLLTFNLLMVLNIDMISIVSNKSEKSNLYQKIYMNFLDLFVLGIFFFIKGNIYTYLSIYIIIKYIILIFMTYLVKDNIFIKANKKIKNQELVNYFNYGLFVMLNAAASILINTIDKIMLKNYINFKAVGIYTISLAIGKAIGVIGTVFLRTVSPKISMYIEGRNNIELEELYKESTKQQIYIGFFLLIALSIFSKEVLSLMGKEYISGYTVVILIGIGQMVNIGTGVCGNIISLSRYYKYEAYFNIFLLVVTIGTNMIFIPRYEVVGAAFATTLTLVLINIIKVVFVYKKFRISPYRLENIKFIISGAIVFILLYIIKQLKEFNIMEVILISIFMFLIYDGILYLLKEREILSLKLIKKIDL